MSRILRRPMFRGGRVDSRGTGITSGLSYAKGGRVGLRLGGSPYLTSPVQFSGDPFTSQAKLLQNIKDQVNAVTGGEIVENQKNKSFLNNFDNLFGEKDTVKTITLPDGSTKQVLTESEGPSTGVLVNLPKFMGGITREEKKIRDQKNELEDNFEVSGNVAGVREGETALDAIMREALAKKDNYNNQFGKKDDTEESTEISKADIEKNKELFAELLGGKKARGEDISNMLMSFAGKALKPEATVKSSFSEFFEEESKRPSSKTKVDQAAAQLAINDYIAGKRSKEATENLLAKLKVQADLGEADLYENIVKIAGPGSNPTVSNLESALKVTKETRGKPVTRIKSTDTIKIEEKDYDSFLIYEDTKRIVYIDSNGNEVPIY